jgi:acetoin utilization deacetylase AcuC-like enzyme
VWLQCGRVSTPAKDGIFDRPKYGGDDQGKGEGFTINIPLGKGHGDRDFAGIIHYMLNPLAQAYHPDMILVSCGFDLYMHDPLGGMTVTPEGCALITFFYWI